MIVGVDPDSDRHGVAIYRDGKLVELSMLTSIELIERREPGMMVSIEDVMANQFVYARNRHGSTSAQSKIAMRVGRCQQAQVELQRLLDHYSIPYLLHQPTGNNWAKNRAMFERVTGWKSSSNEDTRSAAYFGWLGMGDRRSAACRK